MNTEGKRPVIFVTEDVKPDWWEIKRQYGYPIVIKTIQNRMARLLRISGLNPDLAPHSLRHTHTSLIVEAGVSLNKSGTCLVIPMIK
ncbi:hypothetical protein J7E71_19665 [Mesobacillus foraminis]|uniref:hypothetical protein n=1 Tax=Mesobacillus foraminis TaxID=279826 RepID=UPI001BE7BA2A|nr:hypothetical protein [Mesobacillus foraminis]MBT2758089.1 hypothetical protein [Mesobacillus foraminis]